MKPAPAFLPVRPWAPCRLGNSRNPLSGRGNHEQTAQHPPRRDTAGRISQTDGNQPLRLAKVIPNNEQSWMPRIKREKENGGRNDQERVMSIEIMKFSMEMQRRKYSLNYPSKGSLGISKSLRATYKCSPNMARKSSPSVARLISKAGLTFNALNKYSLDLAIYGTKLRLRVI